MLIMKAMKISLADALFPKVRQQVIGLLYGQPDRSFYTNEIIRLTESGTGAIQRELARLTVSGLLKVEVVGKQKHYQANPSSPLFKELRSIALKTFGLADVLLQALSPIAQEIELAFVYGSIAKHEDTSSSDIDLMLISDNLSYVDLFPLLELTQKQLGREINPTFHTPDEWARKLKSKNHFVMQVIKQPKIFLIGTEIELGKLR